MHPRKKQCSNDIYKFVLEICNRFSVKKPAIPLVLQLTENDTKALIDKILSALPDDFFLLDSATTCYDMLFFISNRIIRFQTQESIEGDYYELHFIGFIDNLTTALSKRYYPSDNRR